MWLVFCHTEDEAAVWAYHGLQTRGLAPLELVSAETLAYALYWDHGVFQDRTTLDMRLADGRRILGEQVRGTLNRIRMPILHHWASASEKDRSYVTQEIFGFYCSWLHGLPGKTFNPVSAQGLSGAWRQEAVWMKLAAQAGLPTRPYQRHSSDKDGESAPPDLPHRTVIVVDQMVVDRGLPKDILGGCLQLARVADTPLLGIDLAQDTAGQWIFAAATPMPDLRVGGDAFLNALVETWR
jgi:hypothetical protein